MKLIARYCGTAFSLIMLLFFLAGCSSSQEFSGFSYDPEGTGVTTDKEISPQYKRTIGVEGGSVWVSNEFEGARMSDFYQVNDSLYRVTIDPVRTSVNNSPWYAFKVWADTARTISLQLSYNHGTQRYVPKLSRNGNNWSRIDSSKFKADTTNGTATLTLDIGTNPLWVSGQELITINDYQQWADSLATAGDAKLDTVGYSHQGRPIMKMDIAPPNKSQKQGVLIILGRQHPPEVTGSLAAQVFINEITSQTKLAQKFRNHFQVLAYPLLNPDGVQQGHWRLNGGGVDLNRDWEAFNQPETRAVRDDLLSLKNDEQRTVYYGIDFHSTDENLFYPINRNVQTFPDNFTYQWIDRLKQVFPDYPVRAEPFDTSSPIAKNWIYKTFGADAVTYEIDDRANRDSLQTVTKRNAQIIMKELLEAQENNQN